MTATTITKDELVKKLKDLGNLCRLDGENHFKCAAYDRAADAIKELSTEYFEGVMSYESIDGVGESIALKIANIMLTGTCNLLDELTKEHGDKLELMSISGIGAKTALKFWDQGIHTVEDVVAAVKSGTIKAKRIVDGVNALDMPDRVSWETANDVATDLISDITCDLGKCIGRIEACGSIRRHKESVGDIDIVVEVLNSPVDIPEIIGKCLDSAREVGESKIAGRYCEMNVQVRLASCESFGAMCLYFTGPKHFNISMRNRANVMGYKLNEYGLWGHNGNHIAGKTEEEIFEALGVEYKTPENRKNF